MQQCPQSSNVFTCDMQQHHINARINSSHDEVRQDVALIIASSNKCIATSNKCLTSSNKKLVETSALLVVTRFAIS